MAEVWGWSAFFDHVVSFLRRVRLENVSQDYLEFCLERLETIITGVNRIKSVLQTPIANTADSEEISTILHYRQKVDELLQSLSQVHTDIDKMLDNYLSDSTVAYQSHTVRSGQRGRPRFDITESQLQYLTSLSFTWKQIAKMLGISRVTLYRRRVEFGMLHQGQAVGDEELLHLLEEMRHQYPEMGEVMVLGRLRALGYSVSRDRVRSAIRETDPLNTALRATAGQLARRIYNVPGPNSLWHAGKHS